MGTATVNSDIDGVCLSNYDGVNNRCVIGTATVVSDTDGVYVSDYDDI